jgi:hypothetical protein
LIPELELSIRGADSWTWSRDKRDRLQFQESTAPLIAASSPGINYAFYRGFKSRNQLLLLSVPL